MSNHSFPFASTQARSSSAIYAAIAAVGIISGALVTLQLSAPPSAGAATVVAAPSAPAAPAAKTWDLEPRWWGGNVHHVEQPAPAAPATTRTAVAESDLTFTKGYALRLAARQAAASPAAASAPSIAGKTGRQMARPLVVARTAMIHAAAAPAPRSLTVPQTDARAEQAAPSDGASQTLAFDEPRGFGAPHPALLPNIFGTLH